ncbi:MAG TPA: ATP-grasp domain-containing protein [Casimicrobiaceae bacterium]|nr:ATP-grasp domain-containing protein [Casimicrobiaceae bacterium]
MKASTRVFVYEYLSGGGSPAASTDSESSDLLVQGRAMRDAIVGDLAEITGVATTYAMSIHDAVHVPATALASPVFPEQGESAFEFVGRMAASHDRVWIVAPETDGILADLRHCVPDARWIGCSAASIRIASSKCATSKRLRESGISTTRGADAGEAAGVRWVVKPDDGAGACDTRVHATLASALADRDGRGTSRSRATVEVWEEGEALSLSLLCAIDHVELLSVNRQRIEIDDDGAVHYRGVDIDIPRDPRGDAVLASLARDVARALPGLGGYVGVDVVMRPDGAPVVIEVNPRVTCSYVGLSRALARNVARAILKLHAVDVDSDAITGEPALCTARASAHGVVVAACSRPEVRQ